MQNTNSAVSHDGSKKVDTAQGYDTQSKNIPREQAASPGSTPEVGHAASSSDPVAEKHPTGLVPDDPETVQAADQDDSVSDDLQEEESKLPMSKARCIALVVTLTGAAFLNVSAKHL